MSNTNQIFIRVDPFKQFLQKLVPITDAEYAKTIGLFTKQQLGKGEFLVRQDQVCRHIAFIIKGSFRIYYLNDKGEETTSCFCTENGFTTSYKSFIFQEPSTLSIQAIEDSEILTIDYDKLHFLYNSSTVWLHIGRIVSEQQYLSLEKYASVLNNESAKEKYLRLLKEQPSVIHKATVEEIASYLGITRRTLSRIRQEISQRHN